MANERIVYTFSVPQGRVFRAADHVRFRILTAGRRFGKTHLSVLEIFGRSVNNPGSMNWYVAPTYRQAEQIAWTTLKGVIPPAYILRKDEGDLSIELRNGSILALRGSDNPDSLRGPGLDFVVLDEAAYQDPDGWFKVIRPALSDKLGHALFISSPRGFNWFYDLNMATDGKDGWARFKYTTLEGGRVPLEEIETARSELDTKSFAQEYEASFTELSGRVYYAFHREKNVMDLGDDVSLPLLVGMDFNVNPMSAVLAVRRGGQIHVFAEIEIPNGNTEEMGNEIRRRYPNRPVCVYPDPTGNRRQTNAPVGQTDFTILRGFGFQVLAPEMPYPVSDKINTLNSALANAAGLRRVFVRRGACARLVKGLDGLVYKESTGQPDKSSGLDHITDALAYLVCHELPILGAARRIKIGFGGG